MLFRSKWLKPPKKIEKTPNFERIERLCKSWMILITTRLATQELDQIEQVKTMLWTYRKQGLAIEGEMGVPNLVFKTLRNSGVTEMLLKAVSTLRDRQLSLEDFN